MPRTNNAEKLSITLPPEMVKSIKARVASGAYNSNSEVIREAMRLWQNEESEREARLSLIRQRTQHSRQQIKDGHSSSIDDAFDEVIADLRTRHQ